MGASAGVYAILVGITTYLPNYQFKVPLLGYIKLWHITAFYLLIDVIQIPVRNTGGHIAHLGGALFGFLYVHYASNKEINIFSSVKSLFQKKEKKSPLKTVYNSGKARKKPVFHKNENQQQIDAILDKISKSGYDTLTKEEKDFLFKQGKNQ